MEINDLTPAHCSIEKGHGFTLQWIVNGIGYGEFHFYQGDDGLIHCRNETMSKEFIKKVLNDMLDTCVLDESWKHGND